MICCKCKLDTAPALMRGDLCGSCFASLQEAGMEHAPPFVLEEEMGDYRVRFEAPTAGALWELVDEHRKRLKESGAK
jgi:hypothetical protein